MLEGHRAIFLRPVDIASPGYDIAVNWAPAPGATKAEVTQASATLSPTTVIETDNSATTRKLGNGWVVDIPAGKRLSAITLHGFKPSGQDQIVSSPPDGTRITLEFPSQQGQGYDPPRFVVPALSSPENVRPLVSGARLSNHVLSLGVCRE